jgi:hypothetical protein
MQHFDAVCCGAKRMNPRAGLVVFASSWGKPVPLPLKNLYHHPEQCHNMSCRKFDGRR